MKSKIEVNNWKYKSFIKKSYDKHKKYKIKNLIKNNKLQFENNPLNLEEFLTISKNIKNKEFVKNKLFKFKNIINKNVKIIKKNQIPKKNIRLLNGIEFDLKNKSRKKIKISKLNRINKNDENKFKDLNNKLNNFNKNWRKCYKYIYEYDSSNLFKIDLIKTTRSNIEKKFNNLKSDRIRCILNKI